MAVDRSINRRQFLARGAIYSGCLLAARARGYAGNTRGTFLGLQGFAQEGDAPVDTVIGTELDQRRYTDLSRVSAAHLTTPANDFFIRTGASELLPRAETWSVRVDGLAAQPTRLDLHALRAAAKPVGQHLMECAGNVRIVHFGLISVAGWTGVPLSALLAHAGPKTGASQVLISGFDEYARPSPTSVPGASWIFPIEALARAFLATEINGQPLTRNHGAPVRLVVPGFYGCACIKWVHSITLVDDTVEATSQMREYAVRTLQNGIPDLAREFEVATIDHAALPVRVEKWRVGGKLLYRVTGILWGGAAPVKVLQIRFSPEEEFVPVQGFEPQPDAHAPWTMWTHDWSPQQAGTYAIQLAVSDPAVRARKMDAGYYVRFVEIGEV